MEGPHDNTLCDVKLSSIIHMDEPRDDRHTNVHNQFPTLTSSRLERDAAEKFAMTDSSQVAQSFSPPEGSPGRSANLMGLDGSNGRDQLRTSDVKVHKPLLKQKDARKNDIDASKISKHSVCELSATPPQAQFRSTNAWTHQGPSSNTDDDSQQQMQPQQQEEVECGIGTIVESGEQPIASIFDSFWDAGRADVVESTHGASDIIVNTSKALTAGNGTHYPHLEDCCNNEDEKHVKTKQTGGWLSGQEFLDRPGEHMIPYADPREHCMTLQQKMKVTRSVVAQSLKMYRIYLLALVGFCAFLTLSVVHLQMRVSSLEESLATLVKAHQHRSMMNPNIGSPYATPSDDDNKGEISPFSYSSRPYPGPVPETGAWVGHARTDLESPEDKSILSRTKRGSPKKRKRDRARKKRHCKRKSMKNCRKGNMNLRTAIYYGSEWDLYSLDELEESNRRKLSKRFSGNPTLKNGEFRYTEAESNVGVYLPRENATQSLVHYNPITGSFTFKVSGLYMVDVNITFISENGTHYLAVFLNDQAVFACPKGGFICPRFNGKTEAIQDFRICTIQGTLQVEAGDHMELRTMEPKMRVVLRGHRQSIFKFILLHQM